jgi:hypothetical protein
MRAAEPECTQAVEPSRPAVAVHTAELAAGEEEAGGHSPEGAVAVHNPDPVAGHSPGVGVAARSCNQAVAGVAAVMAACLGRVPHEEACHLDPVKCS